MNRARKYLTLTDMLRLQSQFKPTMNCLDFFCPNVTVLIWHNRVKKKITQNCGWWIILHPNPYPTDETLWTSHYRYYYGRCSDEIHYLVLPAQSFTAWTRHATLAVANHLHFLSVSFVMSKFYSNSLFPRNFILWNRLLGWCFHQSYNHDRFMTKIERYQSYTIS